MKMTVYCDSTGLFSEEECNSDNLTEMVFPDEIVRKWFDKNIKEEYKNEYPDLTFEYWVNELYTADETDGLYDFCILAGEEPMFDVNEIDSVIAVNNINDEKSVVFEGTYYECRRWCKDMDWKYDVDIRLELLDP